MRKFFGVFVVLSLSLAGWSETPLLAAQRIQGHSLSSASPEFEQWLATQNRISEAKLLSNISPPGTQAGVVVASPSQSSPDYFFYWVRDAALVMDTIVERYAQSPQGPEHEALEKIILDNAAFSRRLQLVPNRSGGLGEPKFRVDGQAFDGDWGRPQNDGPALRAITFIHFARLLLKDPGGETRVRQFLYDNSLPSATLIKNDLEFVSHHWREKSFDLWEEVRGDHFYTRLVQRRALVEGASLARDLGDEGAASWYLSQAHALEQEIERHWNAASGCIEATLNRDGGIAYKNSGLDVAVILGVLHARGSDEYFGVSDDRVQKSAVAIEDGFRNAYAINSNGLAGIAIGRYPEDTYNGYNTGGHGNPWFLATLALGEYYYRLAAKVESAASYDVTPLNRSLLAHLPLPSSTLSRLSRASKIAGPGADLDLLVSALREKGDAFLERVRYHVARDGAMSEQMNRDTGLMQGAHDLTWSYAAFLTAYRARLAASPSASLNTSRMSRHPSRTWPSLITSGGVNLIM
jgi:glucoamylase